MAKEAMATAGMGAWGQRQRIQPLSEWVMFSRLTSHLPSPVRWIVMRASLCSGSADLIWQREGSLRLRREGR